jgi:hypothetical protein
MSEPSDLDLVLAPPPRTLEEHLRTLREHSRLIADFFRVHAQAIEGGARVELAADSCYAMSELCDRSANYLELLGKVIPADMANWFPPVDQPRPADCLKPQRNAGPIMV